MKETELVATHGKKSFMVFYDTYSAIKRLSNEEKGLLFDSLFQYGLYGVIPEFDGVLVICFDFMSATMDREAEKYLKTCERNKANRNAYKNDHSSPLVTIGTDRDRIEIG